MSQPLVVSIPHYLGKDEAVRRLKTGLGNVQSNFGHLFRVDAFLKGEAASALGAYFDVTP